MSDEHISVPWLERTVMDALAKFGEGVDGIRDDLEVHADALNRFADALAEHAPKLNELIAAYNKIADGLPSTIERLVIGLRSPPAADHAGPATLHRISAEVSP